MKNIKKLYTVILFSVIALSSCNLGPEFSRTELQQKVSQEKRLWREPSDTGKSSDHLRTDWWKHFNDPFLDQLIQDALGNNIDLKIRLERLQESGLSLKENSANNLPRVSNSANASFFRRQNIQETPDIITDEKGVEQKKEEKITSDSQYYNTGLSVSWELDLWGKKKKNYLATKASYEESKAQYWAECLRVVSEIAGTYFDIRKKDREKHILSQLYEGNMEQVSIYENQHREGLVPEWKVLRQKTEAEDLQKELKDLEQSRRKLENKLAILVGKPPGEFQVPDTKDIKPPESIQVPPGLPSDLLAGRPDIIAAEYRVEKAYHRVGEAQASRLPSISLSGQAGFASDSLSNLLRQWTLGFTPIVNFPVFDGGASKIRVEVNKIQARIAEDEYRQTVFRAFEEVENTLMDLSGRQQQKEVMKKKFDSVKLIHQQTEEKMEMGLISQLELLDIQRELLNSERSLADTERAVLADAVTLCKVLGGGWSPAAIENIDVSNPMVADKSAESKEKTEEVTAVSPASVSGTSARIQIRKLLVAEDKTT